MNGKTAKLIRRVAKAKGLKEKDLKREWLSMNQKQRTDKRQAMFADIAPAAAKKK